MSASTKPDSVRTARPRNRPARPARARLVALVVAAVAVASVTGCVRPGEREGAGSDVDLCDGWEIFDALDQPDFTDADDIDDWAAAVARVADRIDIDDDDEINDELIPDGTSDAVARIGAAADAVRAALDAVPPSVAPSSVAPSTDADATDVRPGTVAAQRVLVEGTFAADVDTLADLTGPC